MLAKIFGAHKLKFFAEDKKILKQVQDDTLTKLTVCEGNNIKKAAFTLAEVLITLGIIGIVAAMTIPNLMTKIQKSQTETKLKRAYAVISQAYRLSYDENGDISGQDFLDSGMTNEEYFNKYWAPYIKQAQICKKYSDCGYKSSKPWTYIGGSKVNTSAVSATARTTFYTNDGILYVIFTLSSNGETGEAVGSNAMVIDINAGESPNVLGKDVFYLIRNVDGGSGIKLWGYNMSNEQVEANCKTKGHACGEWIKRSGWKIPKDYPW